MFIINTNYKIKENTFESIENYTVMTISNKKGKEFKVKLDNSSVSKVQAEGTWFAEWNKDFNNYLVQNINNSKKNKQGKSLKQTLSNIVMDEAVTAPIQYVNGDTLDNRCENLEVFNRNAINEVLEINATTLALVLKDKFGNKTSKALISRKDKDLVVTDYYTWVLHKIQGENCVVANTPEGRIKLEVLLMEPNQNQYVHHINLNPLDNTRENLELKELNN